MRQNLELIYLRRNPFIKLIIPLIISLIASRYYLLELDLSISITLALFIITSITLINKKWVKNLNTNPIFSLLIFILIFFTGTTISAYKDYNSKQNYRVHIRKYSYLKGQISQSLIEKKNCYETVVTIDAVINHQKQINSYGKIKCYFPKLELNQLPVIGDKILFQTKLNPILPPTYPLEFDYKNYLKSKNITHTTYIPLHQFSIYGHQNSLYGYSQQLRKSLIQKFKSAGINGNKLAVLSALFLGQKQALSPETKDNFISAGAMHVLAVSGLHVGIILYLLTFVFDFLLGKDKNPVLKTLLILLLIWWFALLTGLSISVLRSSTMFSFLALGKIISRKSSTYNIIAASAFFLLIANPSSLFDVGFQLSYLALIGIIYFYPLVYNLVYIPYKYWNHLWSITAVSIAAQLITIPLSIFYFHQVPTVALISNMFVIYLAIIIIALSIFTLLFILITPVFEFLVSILNHIINELILIVAVIANIPNASINSLYITPIELGILYSVLISFILYKELSKIIYLNLSLLFLSLFFISDHLENYQLQKTKEILIYPTKDALTINVISNDTNLIYTSDTTTNVLKRLNRGLENNWRAYDAKTVIIKHLNKNKNHRLKVNNESILIVNKIPSELDQKIYDYIIINNNYLNLGNINKKVIGKQFLISSQINPIQTKVLENQNRLYNLNLASISSINF